MHPGLGHDHDGPMTSGADRVVPRWIIVLLALGALGATVTVLGLAWLTVWFQLFGETADRGDYAVASGVTAGGVVFLALAAAAAHLTRAPLWLRWWCWLGLVVMAVTAATCHSQASDPDLDAAASYDTFGSGFQTTLMMPWNWLVVAALLAALAARYRLSAGPAAR